MLTAVYTYLKDSLHFCVCFCLQVLYYVTDAERFRPLQKAAKLVISYIQHSNASLTDTLTLTDTPLVQVDVFIFLMYHSQSFETFWY